MTLRMKFFCALIILTPMFLQAQEVREFYNGSRQMGMGGAAIAVANDETALLSNPAGLGKVRDQYGTVFDPEFDFSAGMYPMYRTKAFTNPASLEQVAATLDYTRNTYFHWKHQLFPSYVAKNFGVGFLVKITLDAMMNDDGTSMQTHYRDDMALVLGYNLRLFDGRIKIGFAGRLISRIEIDAALDPTSAFDLPTLASEGVGLGVDVGLTLAAPWTWLPTLSVVAHDVGGTPFTSGSGIRLATANRPARVAQDIDVAVALFPIHGNNSRSSLTLELQKMVEYGTAVDKSRYYHVGYEWNYADLFFFRMGMNQQYYTLGLEIASENSQIILTTYGEDVGVDGNPVEDRRYMFKYSFRY